jgi:hypothetical protein
MTNGSWQGQYIWTRKQGQDNKGVVNVDRIAKTAEKDKKDQPDGTRQEGADGPKTTKQGQDR